MSTLHALFQCIPGQILQGRSCYVSFCRGGNQSLGRSGNVGKPLKPKPTCGHPSPSFSHVLQITDLQNDWGRQGWGTEGVCCGRKDLAVQF